MLYTSFLARWRSTYVYYISLPGPLNLWFLSLWYQSVLLFLSDVHNSTNNKIYYKQFYKQWNILQTILQTIKYITNNSTNNEIYYKQGHKLSTHIKIWSYCVQKKRVTKPIIVSEWLLFNDNSAIFQLYHGENKLIFNEMMMRSTLY